MVHMQPAAHWAGLPPKYVYARQFLPAARRKPTTAISTATFINTTHLHKLTAPVLEQHPPQTSWLTIFVNGSSRCLTASRRQLVQYCSLSAHQALKMREEEGGVTGMIEQGP